MLDMSKAYEEHVALKSRVSEIYPLISKIRAFSTWKEFNETWVTRGSWDNDHFFFRKGIVIAMFGERERQNHLNCPKLFFPEEYLTMSNDEILERELIIRVRYDLGGTAPWWFTELYNGYGKNPEER